MFQPPVGLSSFEPAPLSPQSASAFLSPRYFLNSILINRMCDASKLYHLSWSEIILSYFSFIAFCLKPARSPPSPLPQNLFTLLLHSHPLQLLCQPFHQIFPPPLPQCPLPLLSHLPLSRPPLQLHLLLWPPWSLSMMLPISGEADLCH